MEFYRSKTWHLDIFGISLKQNRQHNEEYGGFPTYNIFTRQLRNGIVLFRDQRRELPNERCEILLRLAKVLVINYTFIPSEPNHVMRDWGHDTSHPLPIIVPLQISQKQHRVLMNPTILIRHLPSLPGFRQWNDSDLGRLRFIIAVFGFIVLRLWVIVFLRPLIRVASPVISVIWSWRGFIFEIWFWGWGFAFSRRGIDGRVA